MSLLSDSERPVVEAVAGLADCNPFLPERVDLERRALGRAFSSGGLVWHADADLPTTGPNEPKVRDLVERLSGDLRRRLASDGTATAAEVALYHGMIRYQLFQRYDDDWYALLDREESGGAHPKRIAAFGRFARDVDHFCRFPTAPCRSKATRPICSPSDSRRAAPSTISSARSSAPRCRSPRCAPQCGSRSSRTISPATAARFTAAWPTVRR